MSFQLIKAKKNKVTVLKTGNPCMNFPINTKELTCACSRGSNICVHVQYYLSTSGVDAVTMQYIRVPAIRAVIREKGVRDGVEINKACHNFLYDEDEGCTICHQPFIETGKLRPRQLEDRFYKCRECCNIYHLGCYTKWGKGCPLCMKGHPEPKRDNYGKTEEFPALC